MSRTLLYRAAQAVDPYFGHGSHWTPSEQHARRFRRLLEQNEGRLQVQYRGPYAVYRAEVELTEDRWRRGLTGPFEGVVWIEYQYLGADPVPAARVAADLEAVAD